MKLDMSEILSLKNTAYSSWNVNNWICVIFVYLEWRYCLIGCYSWEFELLWEDSGGDCVTWNCETGNDLLLGWYHATKNWSCYSIVSLKPMEELILGWYGVEKSSCGNIRRFNSHHNALILLLLLCWWPCWKLYIIGGTMLLGTNRPCMHMCVMVEYTHQETSTGHPEEC